MKRNVQSCAVCAKYSSAQQPEPMLPTEKTTCPWEIVSTDLFTLLGKNYPVTLTTTLGTLKST